MESITEHMSTTWTICWNNKLRPWPVEILRQQFLTLKESNSMVVVTAIMSSSGNLSVQLQTVNSQKKVQSCTNTLLQVMEIRTILSKFSTLEQQPFRDLDGDGSYITRPKTTSALEPLQIKTWLARWVQISSHFSVLMSGNMPTILIIWTLDPNILKICGKLSIGRRLRIALLQPRLKLVIELHSEHKVCHGTRISSLIWNTYLRCRKRV